MHRAGVGRVLELGPLDGIKVSLDVQRHGHLLHLPRPGQGHLFFDMSRRVKQRKPAPLGDNSHRRDDARAQRRRQQIRRRKRLPPAHVVDRRVRINLHPTRPVRGDGVELAFVDDFDGDHDGILAKH